VLAFAALMAVVVRHTFTGLVLPSPSCRPLLNFQQNTGQAGEIPAIWQPICHMRKNAYNRNVK